MEGVLKIRRSFVFLGLLAACQLTAIVFGQASFAISQAGEDGAFYVQIAHNMARGLGITFDGLAPTTGVHWGWLFLLAGIFRLIPTDDPETLFRIAGVAYFLLLLAAGCILAARHPIAAVLLVAYLANRGHWDMETHLVLLALALLYSESFRKFQIVSGYLLVFARTDMVIFAAVFVILTQRWWVGWGAIVGFIGVGAINTLVDGNPISVSAQIKSAGFNDLPTMIRTIGHMAKYYFPVLEITTALALFFVVVQPKIEYERTLAAGFIASCVLLAVHITHNSFAVGWYLAPLLLTSLLCASCVPVIAIVNHMGEVYARSRRRTV